MISTEFDVHAAAICWAAREIGATVQFLDSSQYLPSASAWINVGEANDFSFDGDVFDGDCVAWFRKGVLKKSAVAGAENVAYLSSEWMDYERGILGRMEEDQSFSWVNKLSSLRTAENKTKQLLEASRTGLNIPSTLITSNYARARAFVEGTGDVVIKPFVPHVWISKDGKTRNYIFARRINSQEFSEYSQDAFTQSPMFYQACIEKAGDIRVAVIGEKIFAVKMSYDHAKGIDHREFQNHPDFVYEQFVLDALTEKRLRNLMARLDVRVVSADFLLSKSGDLYFIDLNPSGAFLFIEKHLPHLNVLQAAVQEFVKNQNVSTGNCPGWEDFSLSSAKTASIQSGLKLIENRTPSNGITYV